MGRLKIVAAGASQQAQAQARGKLFEKLMADVLRCCGYSVDKVSTSVNYAGMEIDIEGRAIIADVPLYAESKCYETEVDCPKFQNFYAKYMAKWRQNPRCQSLFVALPGINSHAKGFYREYCETDREITLKVYEEEKVLETIFGMSNVAHPDTISRAIDAGMGKAGDSLLLYTDQGLFWVQYVVPPGAGIAANYAIFDANGKPVLDRETGDYLVQLYPELQDFDRIIVGSSVSPTLVGDMQDGEDVVEVRGSSECFEYQFPASPEHFVGRQTALADLDAFVTKVMNRQTSSRGLLFLANSGWGKSSMVLASVDRLKAMGHFAIAIDSRSASSSQFVLRAVAYALRKFGEISELVTAPDAVTGFDGAVKAVIDTGRALESHARVLLIFLDQFENLFYLREALKRVTDLFLRVSDAQTNVVLGFSWKIDLVGSTDDFPYQLRDTISTASECLTLKRFAEVETNELLDRLSRELHVRLRRDLRFFLSEFSQGYPWLLKKLCAHVKAQRESGVAQLDIARSLLNVEDLFEEDLRGLSAEERETLERIAKSAPVNISDLGEEFKHELVQSLVDRRLVVRIGAKYDVYWDIFRDYLTSGDLPIQENYILRAQVGTVQKATKLLIDAEGTLERAVFKQRAALTEGSFCNVARDMELLGLARIDGSNVALQVRLPTEGEDLRTPLRNHLQDRLRRNRLVWGLLRELDDKGELKVNDVASLLEQACPYISATRQTWITYARIFAGWMDAADLALFDRSKGSVTRYEPGREIRERDLLLPKRRGGRIPRIQYSPVEGMAIRLVDALRNGCPVDWSGLSKSTIFKSLATLEDLGFVVRKTRSIELLPKVVEFVSSPEKRPSLFAEGASKMAAFAVFLSVLEKHRDTGLTLSELGAELNAELGAKWKRSTAQTVTKIMLNWARHTCLAPGVFATGRARGSTREETKAGPQTGLLPGMDGR